jgi:hypothetical protein
MWYLNTMKFYSTTKKNKILSFAGKWTELENILLSEVTQVQKVKSHTFSLISEYRSNANTAILWKIGHAKGRSHMRGGRVKEGS